MGQINIMVEFIFDNQDDHKEAYKQLMVSLEKCKELVYESSSIKHFDDEGEVDLDIDTITLLDYSGWISDDWVDLENRKNDINGLTEVRELNA